jgi:hypothetical protein
MLEQTSELTGLAALRGAASQFGINLGASGNSPVYLFPDMLASREMILRLFSRSYPSKDGGTIDLLDYFHVSGPSRERRLELAAAGPGRRLLRTAFDARSGVTTVSALLRDPVLGAAVVNASIEELNSYLREIRSSQAGEKVRFIAQRMREVQDSLAFSEEGLTRFRERNRLTSSPELALEEGRLVRAVTMNEQLFLTLRSQYEIARIDQMRSLPDVLVLEKAAPPPLRASPRRVRTVILGAVLSTLVALAAVVVLEMARSFRHGLRERLRAGAETP